MCTSVSSYSDRTDVMPDLNRKLIEGITLGWRTLRMGPRTKGGKWKYVRV